MARRLSLSERVPDQPGGRQQQQQQPGAQEVKVAECLPSGGPPRPDDPSGEQQHAENEHSRQGPVVQIHLGPIADALDLMRAQLVDFLVDIFKAWAVAGPEVGAARHRGHVLEGFDVQFLFPNGRRVAHRYGCR